MSNSKHAHYRYNILDKCFRRRNNPYTIDTLLEEVNEKVAELYPGESISLRTLRLDIQLFRDEENGFGAPVEVMKHKGKNVYLYADPDFTIANKKLLADEQYIIDAAQQLLERYDGHPKYDRLSEALVMFQDEEDLATIPDYHKVLFADKNEAYDGLQYLKPMFFAIRNKEVLKITFQGFKDDASYEYIFHPFVLKQYNQRWFVFGYNETQDINYWSIPLDDRLLDFEVQEDRVIRQDDTEWDLFFNEMVGVRKQSLTQEEPIAEKVVLEFTPERLQYFKTKPIHPYWDEFVEEGKENQVFFATIINLELVQQILSYGKDVKVLEPKGLIELMKEQVDIMVTYYK